MTQKKIVLVVAHEGYQHIEYNTPKKLATAAGITVVTASNLPGAAIGKDGSTTNVDILVKDIIATDYDGIFFIGGPGAIEHLDNKESYKVIKQTVAAHKALGSICISSRILAKASVLTGKRATGWDGDNELSAIYQRHGIKYVREPVIVDGNIITAVDPSSAEEFGKQIVKLMS